MRRNNKALYNRIMRNISREVKRSLNENMDNVSNEESIENKKKILFDLLNKSVKINYKPLKAYVLQLKLTSNGNSMDVICYPSTEEVKVIEEKDNITIIEDLDSYSDITINNILDMIILDLMQDNNQRKKNYLIKHILNID